MDRTQSLGGAYDRIAAHEELCAERYKGINEKLDMLIKGAGLVIVGLVSWMAVQLYTLEPLRVVKATSVASAGHP